jgi:two-component system cell cycle response regulator
MGEFSEAFNAMVKSLDTKDKALKQKIQELEDALIVIKKLEGILPICSFCKKIRPDGVDPRDQNGWVIIEKYIQDRSEAKFSHSICPECRRKYYSEIE